MKATTRIAFRVRLVGALLAGVAGAGPGRAATPSSEPVACDVAGLDVAMRRSGVDPVVFPNPLAVSSAMRDSAHAIAGAGSPDERLRRLQQHLFDETHFDLTNDSKGTYTAEEAFLTRRGNCVTFTTLFIALACAAGIPVRPGLKAIGEVEREGDLILVNDHVVAIYRAAGNATVFDFNAKRDAGWVGLREISERSLVAIHLNNLGVAAVLDAGADRAERYFEASTRLRPDFAEAWGNLGVVLRRAGDDDGALAAYRRALDLDPGSATTLNNLAALYASSGRPAEAHAALQAARLGRLSPYGLIVLGDFELRDGRTRRALHLYHRAARDGPTLPEPWVAVARAQLLRGRGKSAESALEEALARDPHHEAALLLLNSVAD